MSTREKRKRVMERSRRIGHCVCDPRKPCPCPLLTTKNICTCAGEREASGEDGEPVLLTRRVRSAGCAGKIGQKDLHDVLAKLPPVTDPRVLVGMGTADDAGVFRLTDDVTIVQTVDVFTPTVDDPRLFGRIAGCNALSDVYAMGGSPLTALSIIGFPINALPSWVMSDILLGGIEALREAGTVLLGGHSLESEEITFGFAVTGVVNSSAVVTNAGARPGDLIVLTKPLGTGIVSLAQQVGRALPESIQAAEHSMAHLNRAASEIMIRHGATSCTDVTGFGLLGHLAQLVIESGVTAELWLDAIPLLPHVLEYAAQGCFSGANERNADYSFERTQFDTSIQEAQKAVLYDPQTSGGLLMTLPAGATEAALGDLHRAGVVEASAVGRIVKPSEGRIRVRAEALDAPKPQAAAAVRSPVIQETEMTSEMKTSCCDGTHDASTGSIDDFTAFLGAATGPGALDVVTKELIAIALGLAVHCVPCAKAHIRKAKDMGISAAEIGESAALAIAFSGCRALMLWKELKAELLQA